MQAATSSNHTEITMEHESQASDEAESRCELNTMVKETKPNIDNLEYFPINVWLNIFAKTDDIGLLYLSEIRSRFATITPIVFEERYAIKYFVVNGERYGGDHEIYSAQFDHFGKFIKAIEVNYIIVVIDENHWLMEILQKNIN